MADLAELQRQVGQLRRDLQDVATENRMNAQTLATAIRKTRQQIAEPELISSIRRGRPSTTARLWDPKYGEFVQPDLETSLISRLRKGDTVSNTLGEAQPSGIGLRNFFTNSRLTGVETAILNDGLSHAVSQDWTAIAAFGTTGAGAIAQLNQTEIDPSVNPLSTAAMSLRFSGWTAAGTASIKAKSTILQPFFDPTVLPYAVFSVVIFKDAQTTNLFTNVTSATVKLVLRDAADATDLAVSPVLDYKAMTDGSYLRMWLPIASSQWDAGNLIAQVQIDMVTSATGGAASFNVSVGNPQFELSPYQYPSPFVGEPAHARVVSFLASGAADSAVEVNRVGDSISHTQNRIDMGLSSTGEGAIRWGTGAATMDLRLRRSATSVLRLDDGFSGRAALEAYAGTGPGTPSAGLGRLYFSSADKHWHQVDDAGVDTDLAAAGGGGATQVSRDAAAAAADYVARIRLTTDTTFRAFLGLDASDRGSLEFGPGGVAARDVRVFRNAANSLKINTDGSGPGIVVIGDTDSGADLATTALTIGIERAWQFEQQGAGAGAELALRPLVGDKTFAIWTQDAVQRAWSIQPRNANQLGITQQAPAGQVNLRDMLVTGDTNPRLRLRGDATTVSLEMGPGNAAIDIRARRSGAKAFTVDDGAGGNITFNVVGNIQQGGTQVSLVGHGPADHADITRTVMLMPAEATVDGTATLINVGASPQLSRAVNYPDAATSGAFWWFLTPTDWASGVISIRPLWTPAATDGTAHAVRWSVTAKEVATGSDITAAGTTTPFTGVSAARTVNIAVTEGAQSTGITPTGAGARLRIELQRIGADAADTYVGAVRLFALLVEYTANQ